MLQADTPTMSARRADQARQCAPLLAVMAIMLALPGCQDAAAGETTPPSQPEEAAPAPEKPVAFEPLDLAHQTAHMGGVAARVGRALARCDRAVAAIHGARAAAVNAAELCGDAAGALDDIKVPDRYTMAVAECGNAYSEEVSALRLIAQGKSGGADAEDMHNQQDFCLTDLAKGKTDS